MTSQQKLLVAMTTFCALVSTPAFAGRPLTVDDANTSEAGKGHIELWFAGEGSQARQWNISPAFAPIENVELSALLARETKIRSTGYAVQAKWAIVPSRKDGCNFGVVAGSSKERGVSGDTPFGNALVTCNGGEGSLHLNGGAYRPSDGGSTISTWGVALEREFGAVTGHVEVFGKRGSKTAVQAGARTEIAPKLQLDGTFGKRDGETLFSVGIKIQF